MALINTDRHLNEDEIERYSTGAISTAESARFDEHLLICESCQEQVASSDEYVAAMQAASLRLRKEAPQPVLYRRSFHRLIPVFAIAALVILVSAAGVRLVGRSSVVTAYGVNLVATRGAGIEANAPSGRPLHLHLEMAGLPAQSSYKAEMVDRVGKVVWKGVAAAQDSQAVALLPGMPRGDYYIRVYASSGELLREFGLSVGG